MTKLNYSALSVPITYEGRNGKQYVAVTAAGGGGNTDPNPANTESLYVFALPLNSGVSRYLEPQKLEIHTAGGSKVRAVSPIFLSTSCGHRSKSACPLLVQGATGCHFSELLCHTQEVTLGPRSLKFLSNR